MTPSAFASYSSARTCPCCKGKDLGIVYGSGAPIYFCRDCGGFPMYCRNHEQAYILYESSYREVERRACQVCGEATYAPQHMALWVS